MGFPAIHSALSTAQHQLSECPSRFVQYNQGFAAVAYKAANEHQIALDLLTQQVTRLTDAFTRQFPSEKNNVSDAALKTNTRQYYRDQEPEWR